MDHRRTPPLRTARQIASLLGVEVDAVRRWARTGKIPAYRVGEKTLRFDADAVLDAIRDDAHSRQAVTP